MTHPQRPVGHRPPPHPDDGSVVSSGQASLNGSAAPAPWVAGAVVAHEAASCSSGDGSPRANSHGSSRRQGRAGRVLRGSRRTRDEGGGRSGRARRGPARKAVHPITGRRVSYTACELAGGTAYVADVDEIAEVAWVALSEIPRYIPYGLFEPVQRHLDVVLQP